MDVTNLIKRLSRPLFSKIMLNNRCILWKKKKIIELSSHVVMLVVMLSQIESLICTIREINTG